MVLLTSLWISKQIDINIQFVIYLQREYHSTTYPPLHTRRGVRKQEERLSKNSLLTGEENMDIIKNAHERTVMKEKLEEEKTKIVKEYVKKKKARGRGGRGRGRGRGGRIIANPKL